MFTFGIFTTHFPYIAVVAFYAYFLIFGVNKASKGEIEFSDSKFKIEIQLNEYDVRINDIANFHYQNDFDFYAYSYLEDCVFRRKIKHKDSYSAISVQNGFYSVLFGRPPPLMI